MAFNVSDFAASVGKYGVAKASHYECRINFPRGGGILNPGQDLSMRAESVEMPGRSIQAASYRDYGAPREIGYASLYTPITITFLCSSDMKERRLFNQWQDLIIGDHRVAEGHAGGKSFDVGYYDDYVASIIIAQYDETGKKRFNVQMLEAYPRTVNATTLSYASDELIKLTVQFQYRYFRELDLDDLN